MKYVVGILILMFATPALATEVTPTFQWGIGAGSVGMRVVQPVDKNWAVLTDWQQILTENAEYFRHDEHHVSVEARRMLGDTLYLRGGFVGMRSTHVSEGVNVYETGYGLTGAIGSRFEYGRLTGFVDYFGLGVLTNHWATYGASPEYAGMFAPRPHYEKGQVFHPNFLQIGLGFHF